MRESRVRKSNAHTEEKKEGFFSFFPLFFFFFREERGVEFCERERKSQTAERKCCTWYFPIQPETFGQFWAVLGQIGPFGLSK